MNSRYRVIVAIGLVVSLFAVSLSAMAQNGDNDNDIDLTPDESFEIHGFDFHSPEFFNVWERTDRPVLEGDVERSWLWGPAANTPLKEEPYAEAEGSMRDVQYSDKSRMEMPVSGSDAAADDEDSPWAITQGLLALELMTGNLQLGDDLFLPFPPAEISVAGDLENNPGPTYADMAVYMDFGARPAGRVITQAFDEAGIVEDDEHFAQYNVTDQYYIEQTDHNIASVFWEFMQSEGLVYEDDNLTTGPLFLNEFYAVGFPVTEAYWGEFLLRGEVQDILIQCFERRCLTFAPNNAEEWQVESGNVGLHYHEWRYNMIGDPITPDPTPTPDPDPTPTPDPDPELTLVLDPDEATNNVGTDFALTATVMENGNAQAITDVEDVSVSIERALDDNDDGTNDDNDDGDNGNNNDVTASVELEGGAAIISYTGPAEPAVDTITVDVEVNDEGSVTATATKTWEVPEITITGFVGETVDEDANFGGFYLRYVGNPAPEGYSDNYQWAEPPIVTFPEDEPVTFEGTLDLSDTDADSVSFIGLIDQNALEAGAAGYQTGAYIYLHVRDDGSVRIGPSDGNEGGGDLIQESHVIASDDVPDDEILEVTFTIDGNANPEDCATLLAGQVASEGDGCMTLAVGGGDLDLDELTDVYGIVHAAGHPDEFVDGGVPGWDVFPEDSTGVGYDLTISQAFSFNDDD